MRSLTGTLAAAVRSDSRRPVVRAVFDDYDGDRPRLRYGRYYTGGEAEQAVAVCLANDGSLIRARLDGGGQVFMSRVASPGSGSDYSVWTQPFGAGAVYKPAGLALTNQGSFLFLVAVGADTVSVSVASSVDNGVSWSAFSLLEARAVAVQDLAVAANPAGDMALFWHEGAVVEAKIFRAASGWGATAAWPNAIASCTGLAATYQGDWCVAICGTELTTTHPKVWNLFFGDGLNQAAGTWSALHEVQIASAGSGIAYVLPAVVFGGSCWRLFFREDYGGVLAYSRVQWTTMDGGQDFTAELWREPVAFNLATAAAVACVASAAGVWLVSCAGVWFGALPAAALDVSADVVEASVELLPFGGKVTIVIDNAAGLYGPLAPNAGGISPGRRLSLSFGYVSPGVGPETSDGPAYWVESCEWRHERDGRATVEIVARDAWSYLSSWRARRQFVWAAGTKNVAQLLAYTFARAGLGFANLSISAALTALTPAFTINPSETGETAVRRLLAMVPDVVIMRGGAGRGIYPQAADASVYSYGASDVGGHAILAASYLSTVARVNRARAFGPTALMDERFDFADIEATGERLAQVLDLSLTTTTLAGNRAGYMLRGADYGQYDDSVTVPLQPAHELYDVVDLTDQAAGLQAAKRRVFGLSFRAVFDKRTVFESQLGLGVV